MTKLQQLHAEHGQSPWLDNLTRGHLRRGRLRRLIDNGIRGVTSNQSAHATRETNMERSIEASTTIRVAFARAREVILDDPGAVFSESHTADERRERRFSMDLGVDLGAGASVHQSVALKLGIPQSVDHRLVLPMAWRASGREQLLPTFEGALEISETRPGTRLRLTGKYAVPLGVLGEFGDGVVGRRLARRSLEMLVHRLASRLESGVQARLDSVTWRPASPPVDLREHKPSEIYLG